MTRLDSARETAGKTRDTLAPYAATAKETAAHLADGAKQRLGPAVDAIGPKASQAAQNARVQYVKHIAPQLEHAFASLPPEAQKSTLKALHRAQEAALAARLSTIRAADQARSTVVPRVTHVVEEARAGVTPVAQEAQARGAAALTALQGHVTSAEISALAARNIKKERRNGWATGLAVAGAVAIGSGILVWQWWRHQSNPEWLVEPPNGERDPADPDPAIASPQGPGGSHATGDGPAGGSTAPGTTTSPLNGSTAGTDAPAQSGGTAPEPGPRPAGGPAHEDDHPKPHDPRKPH
ncbi:DUF5324 family protein [Kitasatospora sp. NPDC091207]|uniref:DUF5324 family protein n=1 Tax=Kitasatospora sp. NPDC091207 TaxID=3364083 RepID=UPI00380033DC